MNRMLGFDDHEANDLDFGMLDSDRDEDNFEIQPDDIANNDDDHAASEEAANKELEVLIAQAMNSLSIEERRNALHDIHGVADIEDDDPAFIEQKLAELEVQLCHIPDKQAYYMAKASSPAYVTDKEFRLIFLRADNFDAKAAAIRMTKHFETKLELFGQEVLGRDLLLSDLDETDMKALRSGFVQWLPHRDRAGRAVMFWTPGGHAAPLLNRFRASFWAAMTALRDKETQKRGMVGIVFAVGPKMGNFELKAAYTASKLVRSLPMRLVANHLCTDKAINRIFLSAMLNSCGSFARVRIRCHFGPSTDCVYSLMTFGITGDSLPINQDCTVKTESFLERIEKRRQQELDVAQGTAVKTDVVVIPGPFDVLLGRGKQSQENVGNLRYRNLIASYQERYEKARKAEKTAIADEVVQMVKQCQGRFLKEYYADFIEVSDTKAREKVSHSFRSLRSNASKKKQGISGGSSVSSVSTTTSSSTAESGRLRQQYHSEHDNNSVSKRARSS